jgi:hypothetical protein
LPSRADRLVHQLRDLEQDRRTNEFRSNIFKSMGITDKDWNHAQTVGTRENPYDTRKFEGFPCSCGGREAHFPRCG